LEIAKKSNTHDDILYGKLRLWQPQKGPRVNVDTILLSAFTRIKSGERVIELGCAQGAISLLLSMKFPRAGIIQGLELQPELVELARKNAKENSLDDRVRFIEGDLKMIDRFFPPGGCDVVVVNPPYFSSCPGRIGRSRSEALARHDSACSLGDVISTSRYLLKSRGRLYLVMKSQRLSELFSILDHHRMPCKRARPVYASPGKRSHVILVQAAKDAKNGMYLEAPLFIYDHEREYTPELRSAYQLDSGSCL